MEPRDLTHYEKLAMIMFDSYGSHACSGVIYNCRLLVNCAPSDLDMKCITWVGMN